MFRTIDLKSIITKKLLDDETGFEFSIVDQMLPLPQLTEFTAKTGYFTVDLIIRIFKYQYGVTINPDTKITNDGLSPIEIEQNECKSFTIKDGNNHFILGY